MTLLISIEYRTRWGEQLVLRLGKRRIALQYADGGVWTCAVERYAPAAQPAEYRYEVEREGVCIRSEWRPHTLRIPVPGGGAHAAHSRPLAGDALRHAVLLLGIHPGHLRPRENR